MAEGEAPPSRGSIGHPDTCGEPCKYFRKKKGCKDGVNCLRCHICAWKRPHAVDKRPPEERGETLGDRSEDDEDDLSDDEESSEDLQKEEGSGGKGAGKKTNHSKSAIAKYEKLMTNNEKYAHMTDEELEKILPRRADGAITSIGAMLHASGQCSQCVFTARENGCTNRLRCKFCHHDHEPKVRKRQGKRRRKTPGEPGAEGNGNAENRSVRQRREPDDGEVELDEHGNSRPCWLRGDRSYGAGSYGAGYARPAHYGAPHPAHYGVPHYGAPPMAYPPHGAPHPAYPPPQYSGAPPQYALQN